MTALYLVTFTGALKYIFYIIVAIAALLLLVMIHELGHYTAGKILKFKIEEFSVGFGPKIFQKKKKNGELFTLRAIPLGGYCAFDGEDTDEKSPTAFTNQKPWKRLIVLVSGVLFNFISAVIFSFILLTAFGYEKVEVKKVESTSMNYEVLYEGDVIYGIDGVEFDFVHDKYYQSLLKDYVGTAEFKASEYESHGETYGTVPMNIKRGKKTLEADVVLRLVKDGDNEGWTFLMTDDGSEFDLGSYKSTFVEAIGESWSFSFRWVEKIMIILGQLFTGKLDYRDLGGPVTTVKLMADTTSQDFSFIFVLIPVIAVNLAVFNILPIPSLDGARMVFVIIEWIRKKPVNRDIEAKIHMVGLFALLGFVVVIDILHFILA